MKTNMLKHSIIAGAVALALGSSGVALAEMTGKQKATAIGAGTGAVAGAVVGGPVGAAVGAGVGAVVGHKGTDANGRVDGNAPHHAMNRSESVRQAQVALNGQGYSLAVDGVKGPATSSALRDFQAKNGLVATGALDSETKAKLGVIG